MKNYLDKLSLCLALLFCSLSASADMGNGFGAGIFLILSPIGLIAFGIALIALKKGDKKDERDVFLRRIISSIGIGIAVTFLAYALVFHQ
ncbi:MAG: hypothetical protein JNL60_19305 [Bacteroidia bacterium]|nr:hypothetical protein [Bacteroidia bacterium]